MASAAAECSTLNLSTGLPERTIKPAWLISIGLHVVLVIALGLSISPPNQSSTDEPDRLAGIVLANRSTDQRTEYFRETTSSATSTPRSPSNASLLPNLPDLLGDQDLLNVDTDLPATSRDVASSDDLGLGLAASSSVRSAGTRPKFPSSDDSDILTEDPIRNAPPGPQGPPAVIAPFGVEAQGHRFIFLIDRSHSMGNRGLGGMDAAARQVATAIDQLSSHHRFQIIAYNQRLHYFRPKGLTPALDQNKQLAKQFLTSLIASGGTEHDMALRAALRRKPDVLFLFTDGDEPPLGSAQLRRIVSDNRIGASIHTFLFGSGPLQDGNHFLHRLAELNRGRFTYLNVRQLDRRH